MAFGYVFIVIIAVIYAYISASPQEVEYVKSSLDGKDYLVQKNGQLARRCKRHSFRHLTWCLL
jgi:hypothetical protein